MLFWVTSGKQVTGAKKLGWLPDAKMNLASNPVSSEPYETRFVSLSVGVLRTEE